MKTFDSALQEKIQKAGNIAVVVVDDAAKAAPLAEALYEGGIRVMELTLRTPAALEALRVAVKAIPEMAIGAGTVLTPDQVRQAQDAGAAFAVAPGFNPRVVKTAIETELSFAPGVMTPSEIEGAVEMGCTLLKFFPAGSLGGLKTLSTMAAPYLHLNLRYIPLGGITAETTAEYLRHPIIAACGGSWIATTDLIRNSDWGAIRANAKTATDIARTTRDL